MAEHLPMSDLEFTREWTKYLLNVMEKAEKDGKTADPAEILRRCSGFCYQGKHIDEMVEPVTSSKAFVKMLREGFGWTLTYRRSENILICDENNTECLCPVVRASSGNISGMMCCCTEGMLRTIFETGLNKKVITGIERSILRGGGSCAYRVAIDGLTEEEKDLFEQFAADPGPQNT